jgi:hypothetical protein
MTLYSADVFDLAKPVPKKGKGKKTELAQPTPAPEQVSETAVAVLEKPVKEKKPPTEKQLAALAKAQESRKRKREEAEQLKLAAEESKKAAIEAEEEKKRIADLKKAAAREKRLAKKQTPTPAESMDDEIDVAVKDLIPTVKKQKITDDTEPPAWFKQYVAGVKKEEDKISTEKKPKKQIQKEAVEVAQKNWNDEFTRHRVRNEVDGHMSRMY